VSKDRHPNPAAAQDFIQRAIEKITEARRDNKYGLKGHAAKAKQGAEMLSLKTTSFLTVTAIAGGSPTIS